MLNIPNNALPPTGNAPEFVGSNPFDSKSYNLAEQVKLYKENPAQARELASKAGYKLPD